MDDLGQQFEACRCLNTGLRIRQEKCPDHFQHKSKCITSPLLNSVILPKCLNWQDFPATAFQAASKVSGIAERTTLLKFYLKSENIASLSFLNLVTKCLPTSQAANPHVVRVTANNFRNQIRKLTTNRQETRQRPKLHERKQVGTTTERD